MKKTLLASVTILFLICSVMVGYADMASEPSLTVTDITNDIVRISGDVDDNEYVTVIILNPGKTENDINFANVSELTSAVQYIGTQWVDDGHYDFEIAMHGVRGGTFTVIVTVGDDKYVPADGNPFTFDYYYYGEKLQVIRDINGETNSVNLINLVDHAYDSYSYGVDPLYKNANLSRIADLIVEKRGTNGFDVDPVTFNETLKDILFVSAFNTSTQGMKEVLLKDGTLQYTGAEHLNIESEESYTDYLNDINAAGVEAIHNSIIKSSTVYKTKADIKEELRKLVAYYGVVENVKSGYGHVESYLENDYYKDIYVDCGFKLDKLTTDNELVVYKALSTSTASSLAALKDEFNNLVEPRNNNNNNNSFSGGSYTPSGTTPPVYIEDVKPAAHFVDIDTHWAKEDILALADKGIVSGVGNNNFAPNANVTRAEFLKMLVSAMEMTDESTDVAFTDVTANWMKPFIAAAVKNGITSGVSATEFAPNANVTREQSAKFIYNALKAKGSDLEVDANNFADDADISDWAKESVSALKKAGLISGYNDGTVRPANTLTRAEAVKLIVNILAYTQQ